MNGIPLSKTNLSEVIKSGAYIQQSSVAEHAEQRMDVTLAGEVEACADMATRRHHASRIPEYRRRGSETMSLVSQQSTSNYNYYIKTDTQFTCM